MREGGRDTSLLPPRSFCLSPDQCTLRIAIYRAGVETFFIGGNFGNGSKAVPMESL